MAVGRILKCGQGGQDTHPSFCSLKNNPQRRAGTKPHTHTHTPTLPQWKEYSKADKRWQVQDGGVMAIEALTVLAVGPLCLLAVYGIVYRRPWRHLLQVC